MYAETSPSTQASTSATDAAAPVPKRPACNTCYQLKVRCLELAPSADSPPASQGGRQRACVRCARLGIECVGRVQGQRGRRTGWSREPTERVDSGAPSTSQQPAPTYNPLSAATAATTNDPPSATPPANMWHPRDGTPSSSGGGAPLVHDPNPELSLVEAANAKTAAATRNPPPARVVPQTAWPDPVDMRMLGVYEAEQLFESFHRDLNPLIKILDKHLHSHNYVRASSTILYTTVLVASAKYFRKDLYLPLLSHAQQLVTRAFGETLSHIGVIQAICILIYWKESHDRSAWMRVGWCLRLAYQLGLDHPRTEMLPADELEARLILDRERTWMNLLCFDSTYRLNHDFDRTPTVKPPDTTQVDRWVEESVRYNMMDDIYLGASVEVSKIHTLISTLPTMNSAGSEVLRSHIREQIRMVYQKYFHPDCAGARAIGGSPAFNKTRLAVDAMSIRLSRTTLDESNSPTALADFSKHVGNFVATLEAMEACEGFFDRLEDSVAMTLFTLGESLAKLNASVGPGEMQQNILRWLTQVLAVCTRSMGDREDGAPAFIARFYRLLLFHAVSVTASRPPTRPASPTAGANGGLGPEAVQVGQRNQLEDLSWLVQDDTHAQLSGVQGATVADNEYWDSLFPSGASADVLTWLDPAQFDT